MTMQLPPTLSETLAGGTAKACEPGCALILADLTRKLAEHALAFAREGNAEEAAREVEFLRTFATDEPSQLEWLTGEVPGLAGAGYRAGVRCNECSPR